MAGVWKEILDSEKLGVAGGIAQIDNAGVLKDNQVPAIPASKLSGVVAVGNIPNFDASKITSGTLGSSRIPSLDASKITTGSFSSDRIPTLAQSKVSGLSTALNGKVSTSRKINGKSLTSDVNVTKSDVGLGSVENKSSATIRNEISLANITITGVDTSDLIKDVTELPATGTDGQMIKFNGALYVWKESK